MLPVVADIDLALVASVLGLLAAGVGVISSWRAVRAAEAAARPATQAGLLWATDQMETRREVLSAIAAEHDAIAREVAEVRKQLPPDGTLDVDEAEEALEALSTRARRLNEALHALGPDDQLDLDKPEDAFIFLLRRQQDTQTARHLVDEYWGGRPNRG